MRRQIVVRRPLDAAEAARLRALIGGGTTLVCDVAALTDADLRPHASD